MRIRASFLLTAFTLTLAAQSVPESPGPAIGAKVPDFQLADQAGVQHTLQSSMGPKGLMLVFFRSADW